MLKKQYFKTSKKKRLSAALIIIFCLAAALLCAAAAINARLDAFTAVQQESAGFSAAVCAGDEVKYFPFSFSASKGSVSKGQSVKILAADGKWLKVIFQNGERLQTGFMEADGVSGIENSFIKASGITLDCGNLTAQAGATVQVAASLYPKNSNEPVVWSSSDESIATVDNGKITLHKNGSCTITAGTESCSESIEITSVDMSGDLSFKKTEYTLDLGRSADLLGELSRADSGIEFETSDPQVIEANGGKIRAKSAGAAIITAKLGALQASCRVYVKNANQNAAKPLDLVNAYGNINNYHPSVYYFENGWNGYKYWCAYTPYKNSDDYWENPHIQVSNDLKHWSVPKGFCNPLEPVPENYEPHNIYNSDTQLVYNTDTKKLECWWRFYDRPGKRTVLRRKTTSNGVDWSKAEDMLAGELYKYDFLSPAIIYENGKYRMWSVNQNTNHSLDYRESTNGKSWSEIRSIDIKYDNKSLANWHIGLIHTEKGYEALISAYDPKSKEKYRNMDLYYVYSADNITYTPARKILSPSDSPSSFDNMGIYRSCLLWADGEYHMFYSALKKGTGPSGIGLISGKDVFTMS